MNISKNISWYLKLNNKIMKRDKTKLPTNACSSYTQTPLMMTSSYLGVDDSSKYNFTFNYNRWECNL